MPNQTPSIGRVVHYVAYGTPGGEFPAGAHRAAGGQAPPHDPAERVAPLGEPGPAVLPAGEGM